MARFNAAIWRPSTIPHPNRKQTWGICLHNTYGSEAGDLATLDGPSVDCHFYLTKDGDTYQLLDTDSCSWTAMSTANHTCIHIEMEGKRSEALTEKQYANLVRLLAWLCSLEGIPIRKVNPVSPSRPTDWLGLFDHRDLAGIDGNNHTDGLPESRGGWPALLDAVTKYGKPRVSVYQRLRSAGFGPKSARKIISKMGLKEV